MRTRSRRRSVSSWVSPAPQADTALLPFEVGPAADQPRAHVFELRQFDLQLALVGTRPLGEDVQNQAGAIKHTAFERTLEVALRLGSACD